MNLFLLRHGIAAERSAKKYPQDADRPLTPEGRDRLRRVARALHALELNFDLILSSPYLRARQTAEIVAEALGLSRRLQFSDRLAADGNGRELIQELAARRPLPANPLLVGHEPYLSHLASLLLTGGDGLELVLKKGGLCKLALDRLSPRPRATLEWLLTPRQMALMG